MGFPTTLDSFTAKANGNILLPADVNDLQTAIAALEAKVGIDSSSVNTSHDYKLSLITSTDKAAPRDAAATLLNKILGTGTAITLGSDADYDMYYRSSGVIARLAKGSNGQILKMVAGAIAWAAETVTVNGSTTVAGIFEAATAAEITAGTSTGGTGALLAMTPDQLALSAPTFDSTNLTNILKSKNGTFTASTSTTTTITTSFRPTQIKLHAVSGGGGGGAMPATSHGGYDATSATMWCVYTTHDTNGTVNGSGQSASYSLNTTYGSTPTATTIVINNITATSFDVVITHGTASPVVYWEAIGH